jgi:hypothetical protein
MRIYRLQNSIVWLQTEFHGIEQKNSLCIDPFHLLSMSLAMNDFSFCHSGKFCSMDETCLQMKSIT